MVKQRKKLSIALFATCIILAILAVLFAFGVLRLAVFACLFVADLILLIFLIFKFRNYVLKIKQSKINEKELDYRVTGMTDEDIYHLLGIPLQYNEDGSLMDIYQLLKINPVYDADGNRVLTPYELIGIIPKFDEKGNERPSVFVIKNRVGKIAKVDLTSRVLTRTVSIKEREENIIRTAIIRKIGEAERAGDKQAADMMRKVLAQTEELAKKNGETDENKNSDAKDKKPEAEGSVLEKKVSSNQGNKTKNKAKSKSSDSSSDGPRKFGKSKTSADAVQSGTGIDKIVIKHSDPLGSMVKDLFASSKSAQGGQEPSQNVAQVEPAMSQVPTAQNLVQPQTILEPSPNLTGFSADFGQNPVYGAVEANSGVGILQTQQGLTKNKKQDATVTRIALTIDEKEQ